MLKIAGIDAKAYLPGLTMREKRQLISDFNSPRGVYVLIMSYQTPCWGLDLQSNCWNTIMYSEVPSKAHEDQALGLLKRAGQTKAVRLFRLYLDTPFATERLGKWIEMALPKLVSQIYEHLVNESSESRIELPPLCILEGKLVLANSTEALANNMAPIDVETLLAHAESEMSKMS